MKRIVMIMLSLLLITGCVNKDASESITNITSEEKEQIVEIEKESELTENNTTTELEEKPIVNIRNTTETSTNADIEIMNYVNNIETNVNTITKNSDLTETAKSKLKESFITLTDFIFYDGEINGITFNELSTSVKEKVLEIYTSIDQKIESVWPNYKETIKTTSKNIYTNVKEKTIELKNELKSKYKEAIGEDAYNESAQIFEEDIDRLKESVSPTIDYVTEKSKETYENVKEKASNWYQNFKESSE